VKWRGKVSIMKGGSRGRVFGSDNNVFRAVQGEGGDLRKKKMCGGRGGGGGKKKSLSAFGRGGIGSKLRKERENWEESKARK